MIEEDELAMAKWILPEEIYEENNDYALTMKCCANSGKSMEIHAECGRRRAHVAGSLNRWQQKGLRKENRIGYAGESKTGKRASGDCDAEKG